MSGLAQRRERAREQVLAVLRQAGPLVVPIRRRGAGVGTISHVHGGAVLTEAVLRACQRRGLVRRVYTAQAVRWEAVARPAPRAGG